MRRTSSPLAWRRNDVRGGSLCRRQLRHTPRLALLTHRRPRVIFVPTGRPVFKLDKHVTNAEDRYLMTVIATASNPKFTVSRVDIDRPGSGTRYHTGSPWVARRRTSVLEMANAGISSMSTLPSGRGLDAA